MKKTFSVILAFFMSFIFISPHFFPFNIQARAEGYGVNIRASFAQTLSQSITSNSPFISSSVPVTTSTMLSWNLKSPDDAAVLTGKYELIYQISEDRMVKFTFNKTNDTGDRKSVV